MTCADSADISPDLPTSEQLYQRKVAQIEAERNKPKKEKLCSSCYKQKAMEGSHYCSDCAVELSEIINLERKAHMDELVEEYKSKCGLQKRLLMKNFANYEAVSEKQKDVLAVAKNYTHNFLNYLKDGVGLYLEGSNGTGKTHIAAAITNRLLEQGVRVICKSANIILTDIRASYTSGMSEKEAITPFIECKLLIIDDIGKQQATEWSTTTLFNIINERYERQNPTIFTSNYNLFTLEKILKYNGSDGETERAIISRIKEMVIPLSMHWSDYRNMMWKGEKHQFRKNQDIDKIFNDDLYEVL